MNLVVFDLDGTLTSTNQVDNRCFEQTLVPNIRPPCRPG